MTLEFWEPFLKHFGMSMWTQHDTVEVLQQICGSAERGVELLVLSVASRTQRTPTCTCHLRSSTEETETFTIPPLPVQKCEAKINIQRLIDAREAEEALEPSSCETCRAACAQSRTSRVVKAGPVIIFELNRHVFPEGEHEFITTHVDVTGGVRVAGREYVVRAVICHRGASYREGHYLMFACTSSGKWLRFNGGQRTLLETAPQGIFTRSRAILLEAVVLQDGACPVSALTAPPTCHREVLAIGA